jgi:hypothetical protein
VAGWGSDLISVKRESRDLPTHTEAAGGDGEDKTNNKQDTDEFHHRDTVYFWYKAIVGAYLVSNNSMRYLAL